MTCLVSAALFAIVFPWILVYKGVIAGIPISIRGLGDATGILLFLFGLTTLFSSKLKTGMKNWTDQLDGLDSTEKRKIIFLITFFYTAIVVSYKLRAQYNFDTHALDLGFFSNICWNTAHNNWFYSSLIERNFMSVHVNWILWPLSVFYRWGGDERVLLITQALFVGLSIPFLFFIVENVTGLFSLGLLSSLMFVCSPYIGHHVGNDFHPDSWQLPCLMAALWSWQKGNKGQILLFSFFALLAKEDVSIILSGFAFFLILQKEMRVTGILLLIGAGSVFLFHTQIYTPMFIGGQAKSVLFGRYYFLGNDYHEMLLNIFKKPQVYIMALGYEPLKYVRLFNYLLPAMGLALFSPLFLLPPIISALPHLLSQASTQLSLADIYAIPAQPFIFVGSVYGYLKIKDRLFSKGKEQVLLSACLMVAGFGLYRTPKFFHTQTAARVGAFHELIKGVPNEATVAAQQNLLPHFSNRRTIEIFPLGISMQGLQTKYLINPDYVVCDRIGNPSPYSKQELEQAISELESQKTYEKIFDQENLVLFKRTTVESPNWKT